LLNEQNYELLAEIFQENQFNIIRCDYSTLENIHLQEEFINIVEPVILASSQEHAFGINSKYEILFAKNKYSMKLEKHLNRLMNPSKISLNLLLEPFSIVIYAIRYFFENIKIFIICSSKTKILTSKNMYDIKEF
jgi:hypothetical protein